MKPQITFPAFDDFVSEGDSVETTHDGFRFVATLYQDDCRDSPDERDDGFWPSLDPNSAGYIGAKSKTTLRRHWKRAEEILLQWKNDDWHYFGVAVVAYYGNTQLTDQYAHACWGIEGNYPKFSKERPVRSDNSYLSYVAGELATEAIDDARHNLLALASQAT